MKKNPRFFTAISKLENNVVVRSIRGGLVSMIPLMIIGAFALILETFPVDRYQAFVTTFAGGIIVTFLQVIKTATLGVLSLYMTIFIARSYMKLRADTDVVHAGALAASVISFLMLAGVYLEDFGVDKLGPKSMFLAIITGLGSSALYLRFFRFFRHRRHIFSRGADREFNRMLSTFLPVALVVFIFAVINVAVVRVFNVESFNRLIGDMFLSLFSHGGRSFITGFLFVLLSSVLWFFGIHGSDTLEGVMERIFTPGLAENQAAVAAGTAPTSILTKQFFDCFVLMGGCGATICLLIAILLFSRNRARRGLGLTAAFPMIFNINELMVFGLPIIFNPIMLIPFLLVPLVCYSTAYAAISLGLVPVITNSVEWTTPILLGGFQSTGSVAGSILQLVNVVLGVLIYLPFVRMLDKQTAGEAARTYSSFVDFFRKNEQELSTSKIIERGDVYGDFAKDLSAELLHNMEKNAVLFYQPQYHYDGSCIGVEALLRWNHPDFGTLYPPIVVKLADEGGFLPELEETILKRALSERPRILQKYGEGTKLSVNVTGTTIVTPRFLQFCRDLNEQVGFAGKNICLEVTEQAALSFNEETLETMRELRKMGLMLAIDDFSMGQTSLNYLKNNLFDIIKLDGSLVKGLFTSQNCREIISSITQLASSLRLTVLAEFVETEEQREVLHEIGCDCYQGYLYSPAVPLDK